MSGDIAIHFNRAEFACKCGCGFDTVDVDLIEYLEEVRLQFYAPVTILSGCRCEKHNKDVGGAANSQHTKGRAADFVVEGVSPWDVQEFCEDELEVRALGRYDTFTHIDSRRGYARWEG